MQSLPSTDTGQYHGRRLVKVQTGRHFGQLLCFRHRKLSKSTTATPKDTGLAVDFVAHHQVVHTTTNFGNYPSHIAAQRSRKLQGHDAFEHPLAYFAIKWVNTAGVDL